MVKRIKKFTDSPVSTLSEPSAGPQESQNPVSEPIPMSEPVKQEQPSIEPPKVEVKEEVKASPQKVFNDESIIDYTVRLVANAIQTSAKNGYAQMAFSHSDLQVLLNVLLACADRTNKFNNLTVGCISRDTALCDLLNALELCYGNIEKEFVATKGNLKNAQELASYFLGKKK